MNIDNYLQNLDTSTFADKLSKYQRATHWLHNHPTVIKCSQIALYTIGAGLIGASALALAGTQAIVAGLLGGSLIATTWVAFKILGLVISPHQMSKHMFSAKKCDGGELYYDGDVPILKLTANDPFNAGKAHGYLMGDALTTLRRGWDFALHRIAGIARPSQAPELIASLRAHIPQEYITEMEGIVAGYNQWVDESRSGTKLTLDDLIFYHLLPDSIHFELPTSHNFLSSTLSSFVGRLGCTAIADRDTTQGTVLARNMDWPSMGVAGSYTLMIERPNGTLEVSLPGFVGTLTGMNKRTGLCVAMNVCGNGKEDLNKDVRGMPASLFNRYVLDQCPTVSDVSVLLTQKGPLGDYHMTVADPNNATSFHMYQDEGEAKHVTRTLGNDNEPLIITNCRYAASGEQSCHLHYSKERNHTIRGLFNKIKSELPSEAIDKKKLLEYSLSLPHVNNEETTHKILMIPSTRTMKVAFNNEYAGGDKLHEVHSA